MESTHATKERGSVPFTVSYPVAMKTNRYEIPNIN